MKFLYRQSKAADNSLAAFGVSDCCLKDILLERDFQSMTKKPHHHNGYELHIIKNGHHIYETDAGTYNVKSGEFLLIPPFVKHKIIASGEHTSKYSVTFSIRTPLPIASQCSTGTLTPHCGECLDFITAELALHTASSQLLIENRVFELIILILRQSGLHEQPSADEKPSEDYRLTAAKQYIRDNIELPLCLSDISEYCHLSEKQITRLFARYEGISAVQYITALRVQYIEKLLRDDKLSVKAISEMMGFSSEYYFNAFFKKHSGLPPGEYRKMNR
ncbi:MAG: helix-turn-helix transcriptional regulator [Clostridia bacterium]|nr:helix-turn-helix transcriptional regulator [Clostridia bacterium]